MFGGGIYTSGMKLVNCTVTNNNALQLDSLSIIEGAGGIFVNGGINILQNTIVAGNHDPNNLRPDIMTWARSTYTSLQGNNIIGNIGTDSFPRIRTVTCSMILT